MKKESIIPRKTQAKGFLRSRGHTLEREGLVLALLHLPTALPSQKQEVHSQVKGHGKQDLCRPQDCQQL